MKKQILRLLDTSDDKYDQRLFRTYQAWCDKWAINDVHYQKLLANTAVSNWFMKEVSRLERQFLEMLKKRPMNPASCEYHYQGCIIEIYSIYPKPLIDQARPVERDALVTNIAPACNPDSILVHVN